MVEALGLRVMQLKKSEVCISIISSGLFYDKKKKGETQFNVFAKDLWLKVP